MFWNIDEHLTFLRTENMHIINLPDAIIDNFL